MSERTILIAAVVLMCFVSAQGKIIYVDADASGVSDGTSWENAYKFLQDGLSDAEAAEKPVEIRVAQGVYTTDRSSAVPNGTKDRQATFRLISGVTLIGGYAGFGRADPDLRDIGAYETILSGQIGAASNMDNSYHVVTSQQTDQTAILDGFTITGGDANGVSVPGDRGGGMLNENSNAAIVNCTFENNAAYLGAGMYNGSSNIVLIDCTFTNNLATCYGGGICNRNSGSTLSNCVFRSNLAGDPNILSAGSGVKNIASQPILTNCAFRSNSDHGMCNLWSDAVVTNCTFAGHSVSAIYNEHINPVVTNCILWAGGVEDHRNSRSVITYSDVEGGWPGEGNISAAPLFFDADGYDNIAGTDDDDLRLSAGSPCLDAGNNSAVPPSMATDLDGNPRILNDTVDMGVYEGPVQSFVLSATSLTVPEGGTASFTVALTRNPSGPVEVTAAWESGDADMTPEPTGSLVFDSFNYWIPQSITLTAAEDRDSSNGRATIKVSAPGIPNAKVTATEQDNDSIRYLLLSNNSITVPEGETKSCTVALTSDPGGPTEITVAWESGDADVTIESGGLLIFDSFNYSIPQTVILAAAEDNDWTNGQAVIQIVVPAPPGFTGFISAYISATETDNDSIIVYVDAGANGANTGWDWSNALTNLQDALRTQGAEEIRVARGVYTPAEPFSGDRAASFIIPSGVTIKGGYAGFGEADPDARDIALYETVLSGDLNGDDVEVTDGYDLFTEPTRSENSYRVVYCSGGGDTLLDGFTIIGGNVLGGIGGGLTCQSGSPTISNCTFRGNSAYFGGGIYVDNRSYPTIQNNTIRGNTGQDGGGIYTSSACTIKNNVIKNNIAEWNGGGICAGYCWNLRLSNNVITGNRAKDGGGMYLEICHLAWMENNLITGNRAQNGGGLSCINGFDSTLTNNTISGNCAVDMGGGVCCRSNWRGAIVNSILWDNTATNGHDIALWENTTAMIAYSDVTGEPDHAYIEGESELSWGIGNTDADPCFAASGYWADPCNTPADSSDDLWVEGDYHLKSQDWRWDMNCTAWTCDDVTSRCIDAGNPGWPLGDEPLHIPDDPNNQWGENLRVDMGAYGGTAEASMAPHDWALLADLTNDGIVNWADFACTTFSSLYYQPGDLNRDNAVNLAYIALLAEDWLRRTTWRN